MAVLDPNQIFFTPFEPILGHRFIAYIDGIPSYMIKKFNPPSFDEGEVVLDHINVYRKVRAKRRWDDLTWSLYDPVTPSGAQAVMEWARLQLESVTGRAGYSDFYKKDITVNALGPVGDIVREWVIKGAYVSNAKFGEYDWSVDAATSIDCTIKYDYSILQF